MPPPTISPATSRTIARVIPLSAIFDSSSGRLNLVKVFIKYTIIIVNTFIYHQIYFKIAGAAYQGKNFVCQFTLFKGRRSSHFSRL
jgi:hypothetical protein